MKNKILMIMLCFVFVGCARLMEVPKSIWGSSTKALEDRRASADVKSFPYSYDYCFGDVLAIAKEFELDVFINEKKRNRIVLMGFDGVTDTTEVGIFFKPIAEEETKLEIVSLSPTGQQIASDLIFSQLGQEHVKPEESPEEE